MAHMRRKGGYGEEEEDDVDVATLETEEENRKGFGTLQGRKVQNSGGLISFASLLTPSN